VIARSQRSRLINATAEVMTAKGYANTKVEDIVAQARVARPVFYRYLTDKQHAFLEAQRHPAQFAFERCVEAYFCSPQWPARVWRTLEVLTGLIATNPTFSHLPIVECYAAGPTATRRAEEITRPYTFFLEEGYGYRAVARSLPRLCSEAIAGAILEIVRHYVARNDPAGLAARLPQLTYIAVAPFTGADEAIELVEELSAQDRGRG
jgi:AcrR family transcriptional regulator